MIFPVKVQLPFLTISFSNLKTPNNFSVRRPPELFHESSDLARTMGSSRGLTVMGIIGSDAYMVVVQELECIRIIWWAC